MLVLFIIIFTFQMKYSVTTNAIADTINNKQRMV